MALGNYLSPYWLQQGSAGRSFGILASLLDGVRCTSYSVHFVDSHAMESDDNQALVAGWPPEMRNAR